MTERQLYLVLIQRQPTGHNLLHVTKNTQKALHLLTPTLKKHIIMISCRFEKLKLKLKFRLLSFHLCLLSLHFLALLDFMEQYLLPDGKRSNSPGEGARSLLQSRGLFSFLQLSLKKSAVKGKETHCSFHTNTKHFINVFFVQLP